MRGRKKNKKQKKKEKLSPLAREPKGEITDVEDGRSFSNSKQLVHGRIIRFGTGIFPINSNRNLYTAIRASQYNAMYMYICIYILVMWGRVGSQSHIKPTARLSLTSGHSPRVSSGDVSVQQHSFLHLIVQKCLASCPVRTSVILQRHHQSSLKV